MASDVFHFFKNEGLHCFCGLCQHWLEFFVVVMLYRNGYLLQFDYPASIIFVMIET